MLKLIKLARKFEAKLAAEGQLKKVAQPVRIVTGPGQSMMVDPSKVQMPPQETQHQKLLDQIPPPPPQPQQQGAVIQMPEANITGTVPNPNVRAVQNFLSQELAVKRTIQAPLTPDGIMGPETIRALKNWARVSGIGNFDLNRVFQMALARANGNQVSQQIANIPTPGLQQAKRNS